MAADHGHSLAGVRTVDDSAPTAILPAGESVHAGFWRRVAAYFIDGLIVGIAAWIVGIVLILGFAASGGIAAIVAASMLNYIVMIAMHWLYFALQESSAAQATLGKRAFGLKVTDDRAHRISFARATGRFFGKFVSSLILGIGYLLAGFTERKQALHDIMASTFVVFRDVQPGQPLPATRPPMPWYGWVINIVFMSLAPLGIVAAIALPAYQDYTARAQAYTGIAAADAAKAAVVTFYAAQNRCPESNEEAGLGATAIAGGYVSDVSIKPECRVVVTFAGTSAVNMQLRGQQIEMTGTPDAGNLAWTCTGSIPDRLLPMTCR